MLTNGQNYAVIGAMWGDEGKGRTVDYICSQLSNPLVVRYNGGPQAGHTVTLNGKRHIFSHFGSGTLRGARTYWSSYCLFDPNAFLKERQALIENFFIVPQFNADPRCLIITPWDVALSRLKTYSGNSSGSCGMGVFETLKRNRNPELSLNLYMFYEFGSEQLEDIVWAIYQNYLEAISSVSSGLLEKDPCFKVLKEKNVVKVFIEKTRRAISCFDFSIDPATTKESIVFEGAQGLALDEHFGNFPYVTPSRTGSCNVTNLCREWDKDLEMTYYVTRPYLTRHGKDPNFKSASWEVMAEYFDIKDPTNVYNPFQEDLKVGAMDFNLLRDYWRADSYARKSPCGFVLSCKDQIRDMNKVPSLGSWDIFPSDFSSFRTMFPERLVLSFENP